MERYVLLTSEALSRQALPNPQSNSSELAVSSLKPATAIVLIPMNCKCMAS